MLEMKEKLLSTQQAALPKNIQTLQSGAKSQTIKVSNVPQRRQTRMQFAAPSTFKTRPKVYLTNPPCPGKLPERWLKWVKEKEPDVFCCGLKIAQTNHN